VVSYLEKWAEPCHTYPL